MEDSGRKAWYEKHCPFQGKVQDTKIIFAEES